MENIKNIFRQNGISEVSFCSFSSISDRLISCRASARLPKNASSVIVCLFPYLLKDYSGSNLSRYACVADYHSVADRVLGNICGELKKQFPNSEFAAFADNSPIPEVYAAARAGLGCVGKNGLIINETYGSWVFIGEIVTDLRLDITDNEINGCLNCGLCSQGCCGKALSDSFYRESCLSHITQKKGELKSEEAAKIKRGGLVWGCDGCQLCCPMNSNVKIEPFCGFSDSIKLSYSAGDSLDGRAYAWRGEKVMLRNYGIIYGDTPK